MSDLQADKMMIQAYGAYLDQQGLEFSTRNQYRRELIAYFENPEQNEKPQYFDEAVELLRDYTS